MHGLGGADRGEVAITLIGENHGLGMDALDGRGHRGSTAMRSLDHVTVEEVVVHDRAAHGRDAYGGALDAQLVDRLGDEPVPMHDAVRAAGTVVEHDVGEGVRTTADDGLALMHVDAVLLVDGKVFVSAMLLAIPSELCREPLDLLEDLLGVGSTPPVRP